MGLQRRLIGPCADRLVDCFNLCSSFFGTFTRLDVIEYFFEHVIDAIQIFICGLQCVDGCRFSPYGHGLLNHITGFFRGQLYHRYLF